MLSMIHCIWPMNLLLMPLQSIISNQFKLTAIIWNEIKKSSFGFVHPVLCPILNTATSAAFTPFTIYIKTLCHRQDSFRIRFIYYSNRVSCIYLILSQFYKLYSRKGFHLCMYLIRLFALKWELQADNTPH